MSEEDFRSRLLAELSEQEPPPLGGLVDAALGDGLRRRRARRSAQILACAAGVAAVAVATTAVARPGAGPRGVSAVAGATPTTVPTASETPTTTAGTATGTPDPSATPTTAESASTASAAETRAAGTIVSTAPGTHFQPTPPWMTGGNPPAPAHGVAPTAQALAAVLIDDLGQLGGGPVTHPFGTAGGGNDDSFVFWNKSSLGLNITPPGQNTMFSCKDIFAGATCYQYRLPDGTLVNYMYIPGHSNPGEAKDSKIQANIVLIRPDNTRIGIIAVNGREDGQYGPDRADLPLSEQQLWSIVSDPRLGMLMDQHFVDQANASVHLDPTPY